MCVLAESTDSCPVLTGENAQSDQGVLIHSEVHTQGHSPLIDSKVSVKREAKNHLTVRRGECWGFKDICKAMKE